MKTIGTRILLLGACAAAVLLSATSLIAGPAREDLNLLCCESSTECFGGKCCDYAELGEPPCTPDHPNICKSACIPQRH